jgi:hypothetical protein
MSRRTIYFLLGLGILIFVVAGVSWLLYPA